MKTENLKGIEDKGFSCYIMGEDTLILHCAEMLLAHNVAILGIISNQSMAERWAQRYAINYYSSVPEWFELAKNAHFDYLFSILNSKILGKDIIRLPQKGAINYHNSLLPKYAGVHATSWAIYNCEPRHGITWHFMTEQIDEGDIVKQSLVAITPQETALSLNIKCLQAAGTAFNELITELQNNTAKRLQQDQHENSYFSYRDKLPGNGLISWQKSAEENERLFRALNFGNYTNRLGSIKLFVDNEVYIPQYLKISGKLSEAKPGTIVQLSSTLMQIATTTHDLILGDFLKLDGEAFSLDSMCLLHKLSVGKTLTNLSEHSLKMIQTAASESAINEFYWVKQLAEFHTLDGGYLENFRVKSHIEHNNKPENILQIPVKKLIKLIQNNTKQDSIEYVIFSLIFVYFLKLNHLQQYSVLYQDDEINNDLKPYYTPYLPINFSFDINYTFDEIIDNVKQIFNQAKEHGRYLKDVYHRYPELKSWNSIPKLYLFCNIKIPQELTTNSDLCIHLDAANCILSFHFANQSQKKQLNFLVQKFSERLESIYAQFVNRQMKLKNIYIVSAEEYQDLIYTKNIESNSDAINFSLNDIYYEQLKYSATRPAIYYNGRIISYQKLDKLSDQVAQYLIKQKINLGDRIVILMNRSSDFVITILGILKAGAVYVPIDHNNKLNTINYIITDTSVKLIITNQNLDKLKDINIPVVEFETILSYKNKTKYNSFPTLSPQSIAYIMYTSGSTNKPKGVIIRHQNISRVTKNANFININADDRIAFAANIAFDGSTFEIWSALLNGVCLVCIPNDVLLSSELLASFLIEQKISILFITTRLFESHFENCPDMFRTLNYLLFGGESLSAEKINRLVKNRKWMPKHLINVYGPTETTIFATWHEIILPLHNRETVPIGKAISNTQLYVLDASMQPLPEGAIGELYIGGEGVANGYLNNQHLTQEHFLSDPFNNISDKKIYRSGDIVRWLRGNVLEYLGRMDRQIKVRGFRVELSAIESTLLAHKEVRQCLVQIKHVKNQPMLVAYIAGYHNRTVPSVAKIRQYLTQELPNYMVPNYFVMINEFPLNANGKTNVHRLPMPDLQHRIEDSEYVAPITTTEKTLATLWTDLLGVCQISVHDNFFNLGGHSLLITNMIIHIRSLFQIDLSVSQILDHLTISSLAKLIEQAHDIKVPYSVNLEFTNDAFLSETISASTLPNNKGKQPPENIFLTGATGFLGCHLIHTLIKQTRADIYCLVRSPDEFEGMQIIKQKMQMQCLATNELSKRVKVVVGDLSREHFGLSDNQFAHLANTIDAIIHNGAQVNHIYNYNALKTVNAYSITSILELACQVKQKSIHYVSTLSAVVDKDVTGQYLEDFPRQVPYSLHTGYNQSKWVVEKILGEARQLDLPINIYRPGWITGEQKSGIFPFSHNQFACLLKACIDLGYAPNVFTGLNILPVDFLSQAIVHAVCSAEEINNVYNFVSPHKVSWVQLIEWINQMNYPVQIIPLSEWLKSIEVITNSHPFFPFLPLYLDPVYCANNPFLQKANEYIDHNSDRLLNQMGVEYPAFSKQVLQVYFNYLVDNGFIVKRCKNHINDTKIGESVC